MKIVLAAAVLLSFASAPVQCAHDPDPTLRGEDTAGDALWTLAQKMIADHDEAGAKKTLRFLVERYPSSRHAPEAKEQLARLEGADAGA